MGAGILPMTIIKNSIFFLLGKEKSGYWGDFGGSSNINESLLNTAIREGYEELDGFLGDKDMLKHKVLNNLMCIYNVDRYSTYCFYIDHREVEKLPYYFNNHRRFIDNEITYVNSDGVFEKTELRLFSTGDLKKEYNKIRPFYREVVDKLIEQESRYYSYLMNNDIF